MPGQSWFLPENRQDAVDCLEVLPNIIDFLVETLPRGPEEEYVLSPDATSGLGFMLMFMRDTMETCNAIISKEV